VAHVWVSLGQDLAMFRRIFSHENLYALLLCLLLIAILVMTTSQAPVWIYQGF
jgi:hypothetical protein